MKFKKLGAAVLTFLMLSAVISPAYAVSSGTDCSWKSDSSGWWLQYNDGNYAENCLETVDGSIYLFGSDGYMKTGWQFMDGKWYFFTSSGYMAAGWQNIGGCSYYFYDDGHMASDEITPDGYYVNASGQWAIDTWKYSSGGWWYSFADGGFASDGIYRIEGKDYSFDKSGYLASEGWYTLSDADSSVHWYYVLSDGSVARSQWISGSYYVGADGFMLTDTFTPDGYYVDKSGNWIPGYKPVAPDKPVIPDTGEHLTYNQVPAYNGSAYAIVNDNIPYFTDSQKNTDVFETYGPLDSLGRCTTAFANICTELMPSEDRESIGMIKPTGWHTVKYDIVDGKYLYNRCHLIGFQLAGENANEKNLITGTRYLNIEGMLPFENMIADYVKATNNHVLYRVTPFFEGNDLVARGVEIEAYSVEDDGDGILLNVFAYNVQPGITINYDTGESQLDSSYVEPGVEYGVIRGNSNSKIYHCPGQRYYEKMADSKYLVIFQTEQEAIDAGYRKSKV